MKHYSKSQYMKQFLQANTNHSEPRAPPTQFPLHTSGCTQGYSGTLWLHSNEDLPGGRRLSSWPPGTSPTAQILQQHPFHQDTRETMNAQIFTHTHTHTQNQEEVKILGKTKKSKYLMPCLCKKEQRVNDKFSIKGRSIHKSRRNTSY